MSEFSEKKELEESVASPTEVTEDSEFSTVLGAPVAHKDTAENLGNKTTKRKRLFTIISAVVAVAVISASAFAVVKFVDIKDSSSQGTDQQSENYDQQIPVIDYDSTKLSTITLKNANGEFKLYAEQIVTSDEEGEQTTTTVWRVEGIDTEDISNTLVNNIATNASSIKAIREITDKTPASCGFENPQYEISVASDAYGGYKILVGDTLPDGMGTYLKLDGQDMIYLVSDDVVSDFGVDYLGFADLTKISGVTFSFDTTDYVNASGYFTKFDSLVFSGSNFENSVTVVCNPSTDSSADLVPYLVKTPINRYADSQMLDAPITLFTDGLTVVGAYDYDTDASALARVGLDKPDVQLTLTINGESKTYKVKAMDENYCAVVSDETKMIHKVSRSALGFIDYSQTDIYSDWVAMNSINDLAQLKYTDEGETYTFKISSTKDEDENTTYDISCNGNSIDASKFQSFYTGFVGLTCVDFYPSSTTLLPHSTIEFTLNDGTVSTLSFYKTDELKYQYSVDGVMLGKVTSSEFNKVIKNLKLVANNQEPTP